MFLLRSNVDQMSDLEVIQRYLNMMRPQGDYNDEIIATYLGCNGMLSTTNHCLERLVCQYSDPRSRMKEIEKEVTSL